MAILRIRLVTSRSGVAGTIRAAQLGYPFTHAEVEVPDGYLGAHLLGGVAIRPIGYDAGPTMLERFFELAVDDARAEAFHAYLHCQLGKPYDLHAIADFAKAFFVHPEQLRPEGAWIEPDRWFCSELVTAALIHAGIFPRGLATGARHVTPQNLAFALSAAGLALPQATGPSACPAPI